jgi:hypothetical protein
MADEEKPAEELAANEAGDSAAKDAPEDQYKDEYADDSKQEEAKGDVAELWARWKDSEKLDNGKLSAYKVEEFLSELSISMGDRTTVEHFIGGRKFLAKEDVEALVHMLLESPTSPTDIRGSSSRQSSMKQILNAVLESGTLAYDDTVVKYMAKLDEHKKKCEADGRYTEAKAAASRLADLRTAQVARMRQEILSVQTRELSEVQRVYEEETKTFNEEWEARIEDFGRGVRAAQKEMKNAHMVSFRLVIPPLTN